MDDQHLAGELPAQGAEQVSCADVSAVAAAAVGLRGIVRAAQAPGFHAYPLIAHMSDLCAHMTGTIMSGRQACQGGHLALWGLSAHRDNRQSPGHFRAEMTWRLPVVTMCSNLIDARWLLDAPLSGH